MWTDFDADVDAQKAADFYAVLGQCARLRRLRYRVGSHGYSILWPIRYSRICILHRMFKHCSVMNETDECALLDALDGKQLESLLHLACAQMKKYFTFFNIECHNFSRT